MDAESAKRWRAASEVAGRQHGRVTTAQLADLGLGRGAVEKAVRAGRLHREHRGVYAVGHTAPSRHGRWMSAVLACGDGAALSLRSAATQAGIRDGEGPRVDVTVPTAAGRRRPGVAVHRAPLLTAEVVVRDGIPVTTVARTIADLAFVLEPDDLRRTVREAQYRRVFDLQATLRAAERRPSRALRDLLGDLQPASSPLDDAFLRLVDRYGLPRPAGQQPVLGHAVDYVWEAERVAVELDGYDAHVSFDAFQRDRSQANLLQLAGWIVLRFTRADVVRRPRQTAQRLARALWRETHPMDAKGA